MAPSIHNEDSACLARAELVGIYLSDDQGWQRRDVSRLANAQNHTSGGEGGRETPVVVVTSLTSSGRNFVVLQTLYDQNTF